MTDLAPAILDGGAATEEDLQSAFTSMVEHPEFPCLGARSAFRQDRATIRVYDELGTSESARELLADLTAYVGEVDPNGGFATFIAIFRGPDTTAESVFEDLLWAQLRQLHAVDEEAWNPEVASDPDDPHFAFSVAGTAFFVVGLHPGASRDARRSPTPTLVFNLHEQFEQLRASGNFPRMRDLIRARDEQLQGSVNPMVADHGAASEARQYSGRNVAPTWTAPFDTGR